MTEKPNLLGRPNNCLLK